MRDKVAEFLQSEEGKMNAERFLKAVREHRLLCTVKRVSSSGMSRVISFHEVVWNEDMKRMQLRQFNWFLGQMGWTYLDKDYAIRVGGCGMDMIYHVLYTTVDNWRYYGFEVEPRLEFTTCDYMYI